MNAEMDGGSNAAPPMAYANEGAALPNTLPNLIIRKDFPETWIYSTINDFGLVPNMSDNSECSHAQFLFLFVAHQFVVNHDFPKLL